jgi:hypothetical protein
MPWSTAKGMGWASRSVVLDAQPTRGVRATGQCMAESADTTAHAETPEGDEAKALRRRGVSTAPIGNGEEGLGGGPGTVPCGAELDDG